MNKKAINICLVVIFTVLGFVAPGFAGLEAAGVRCQPATPDCNSLQFGRLGFAVGKLLVFTAVNFSVALNSVACRQLDRISRIAQRSNLAQLCGHPCPPLNMDCKEPRRRL